MSVEADLADAAVTLVEAVKRFEHEADVPSGDHWQQVRRAVGYMVTNVAWASDTSVAEVLRRGNVAEVLGQQWDVDSPFE